MFTLDSFSDVLLPFITWHLWKVVKTAYKVLSLLFSLATSLTYIFLADEQDHLSNVESQERLYSFLSLCFFNICDNVLDFRTYLCPNSGNKANQKAIRVKSNISNIDVRERISMCQIQSMCLELLCWWDATYILQQRDPTEEVGKV